MRVIIAILDFIAWRTGHALRGFVASWLRGFRSHPYHLVTLSPCHGLLSGPTEGPGCVTDDASEHGRSLSGRMPASPSGADAFEHSDWPADRPIENPASFGTGRLPLVITGQGDFIHACFG